MGLILENAFKKHPQESQLLLTENKSKKKLSLEVFYIQKGKRESNIFCLFFFPPDIDKWNRISFGVHSW